MNRNEWSDVINTVLVTTGYSQRKLATRLGITHVTLSEWAKGFHEPRGRKRKEEMTNKLRLIIGGYKK